MLHKFAILLALACTAPVRAHDTWVETNTNLVRAGDAVYIDLCLGNHGNEHRDFKLAGKTELGGCTLQVIAPDGKSYDLVDQLFDVGYAPKEGFWRCKFSTAEPGLHLVSHTRDKVVNHGRPLRAIKSGKALFVASPALDRVPAEQPGYDRVLGHALEIVPLVNPVTPMGPGKPIKVQVLFHDRPLAEARISFIPRGQELRETFDDRFERMTDANGCAALTPTTGNQYLVVVHHQADAERGDGYEGTTYSATLTVFVPELCPCCAE